MRVHTLRCQLLTSCGLDQTFAFFEDPYNLAKITPESLSFRVTSQDRIVMRAGAEITYRIQWMGIGMNWKTLIREYDPPLSFVDEQAEGPYALWRHHHTFTKTSQGTVVGDEVQYALPLGPLGLLAHGFVVRRQLLEIFRYRQQQIGRLLGGNSREILAPMVD